MSEEQENIIDPNACREYNRFTRRQLLSTGVKAGVLSALGLGMSEYFAMSSASAAGVDSGSATSAVLIWMGGGASHLDTFDLKPNAPAEIRGAFNPIKTVAPGVEICEHLPLLAKQADKFTIVRSMTTPEAAHERGTHYMMTGFEPLPGFGVPSYGSVAAKFLPPRGALPPYIAVPSPVMYGGAGFLGAALDPFAPGGDPNDGNFKVRDLELAPGITTERMDRRRQLREAVDSVFSRFEKGSDRARTVDAFYNQAYTLLSSEEARGAFDLTKEKPEVREAYGRSSFGQSLLLSRRLVEGGVRFVSVSHGGWDTHNNGFNALKNGVMPTFDKALAAFLDDLHQRGLLKKTLVLVLGEFGRTPIINRDGGRDHHPRCFSVLMAGGGVRGGNVVGASDTKGFEPAERPVRPEDLSATIYHCLGIDYTQSISSPEGVRITLSRGGRPVEQGPGVSLTPSGRIEAIHVAVDAGAPVYPIPEALLRRGVGIDGDRYGYRQGTFSDYPKDHELTLIEAEAVDAVEAEYGLRLAPGETRRNLTTRGIRLNPLVGRRFRIGGVLCEGTRLCHPCAYLEKVTGKGGLARMLADRGGLRAIVLEDGVVKVGDAVIEVDNAVTNQSAASV